MLDVPNQTFDFSTLNTSIPHDLLKSRISTPDVTSSKPSFMKLVLLRHSTQLNDFSPKNREPLPHSPFQTSVVSAIAAVSKAVQMIE